MDGDEWLLVHVEGNPDALHRDYSSVPLSKDVLPAQPEQKAPSEAYPTIYSQEYESQFLAHATMEPMNCTARVSGATVVVRAPPRRQHIPRTTLARIYMRPTDM